MLILCLGLDGLLVHDFPDPLRNCFYKTSSLVLDCNTNELAVDLEPTGFAECAGFTSGVEALLVMGNTNVTTPLRTVIANYSYLETHRIVFLLEDTITITDESFAQVSIFSHGNVMEVMIYSFIEQKSTLLNCFSVNSSAVIHHSVITFELWPTRSCMMQFSDANIINGMRISIAHYQYDLSSSEIAYVLQQYQAGQKILTELAHIDEVVILSMRRLNGVKCRMEFDILQDSLVVTFSHSFGSVKT